MLLIRRLAMWSSTLTTVLVATSSFALSAPHASFTSAEHTTAGDEVKFFFPYTRDRQAIQRFHLPSGLDLTYGEIIAMGDMYGIPKKAISTGKTADERKLRFYAAFDTFALNPNVVNEATKIIATIRDEQQLVLNGMAHGERSEIVYKRIANEMGRRFNCITGGSCETVGWWLKPGRYLELAKYDYDHFGKHAWLAYQTGHEIAMTVAAAAGKTGDTHKLAFAYALNGFASHFLSDSFATGHLRTPRQELPDVVTPSIVGTVLTHYMHDEENHFGLHVHNLRGDHWTGYGDCSYLSDENSLNRIYLNEALQLSVDEVFAAYQTGRISETGAVAAIMPIADETNNTGNVDIAPMFYLDSKSNTMMRRVNLADAYDKHWTKDWWGWATLTKLIELHGDLPSIFQAQLAQSPYAEQALTAGIIRDKTIVNYLHQHAHH